MNNHQNLVTKITELTSHLETNYPELYRSLSENPLTITAINHPQMNKQGMVAYLDSLKHHLVTNKNNTRT